MNYKIIIRNAINKGDIFNNIASIYDEYNCTPFKGRNKSGYIFNYAEFSYFDENKRNPN